MSKIKIEIRSRFTGLILFEYEKEDNTIKDTLLKALADGANLDGANLTRANLDGANLDGANLDGANLTRANLYGANLDGANLTRANLYGANLYGANLTRANLTRANLTRANLDGANLDGANLTPIKDDLFAVLLRAIPEIPFLKKRVIEGKIDGSVYEGDGECACLSGTLVYGAHANNGPTEELRIKSIMSVRNSIRPIERFFALIKPDHTPKNHLPSKLVLEWIEEFENYINPQK